MIMNQSVTSQSEVGRPSTTSLSRARSTVRRVLRITVMVCRDVKVPSAKVVGA